jgi:threonine dehydratase
MAHLCETVLESKGMGVKLISSSGGNAGLTITTVAPQLRMEVTVIVPETN